MIFNMHDDFVDAKVLETVIVIRSINASVYIIAEINDAKCENYLIKSKCNEIIMSEEYNRFLLSKSITEPGMSKVVCNLLRTQNFRIVTRHPVRQDSNDGSEDAGVRRQKLHELSEMDRLLTN